jgi:hypothetical protein
MTRAVAAKGDKCKDVVVKFKLLKQEDTIHLWKRFLHITDDPPNQNFMSLSKLVSSSCFCSGRTLAIGWYHQRRQNCTTG